MEVFSGYGFNKAHSSGYAFVAYQAAYLKAHYPAEYMAANLNSEIGNIERLVVLIDECRRMGLSVLPPDVDESTVDFMVLKGRIRMGMAAVRNVGKGAVEMVVAAREADGPFSSLFDFCERVDLRAVNRRAVESLICAGALDSLEGHRAQLLAGLERAMDMASQEGVVNNQVLPGVPEWTVPERLAREKEMLGFYL